MFTLQTMTASDPEEWAGKVDGFSLHAGVAAKAHERKKLEGLCRYIAHPAVAENAFTLAAMVWCDTSPRIGSAELTYPCQTNMPISLSIRNTYSQMNGVI